MRTCICRWFYYFFKICLRTSLSVIFQTNVYVNNPKTLLGRKCRDHSGCARLTRFLVSEHICTFTQSHCTLVSKTGANYLYRCKRSRGCRGIIRFSYTDIPLYVGRMDFRVKVLPLENLKQ